VSNAEAVAVWYGSNDSTPELISTGNLHKNIFFFIKLLLGFDVEIKIECCYLEMRLEIEVCLGIRNIEHVGLGLAPVARFAREAAERRKHLAADIVRDEHRRRFWWVFLFLLFWVFDSYRAGKDKDNGLWAWVLFLGSYEPNNKRRLLFPLQFLLQNMKITHLTLSVVKCSCTDFINFLCSWTVVSYRWG